VLFVRTIGFILILTIFLVWAIKWRARAIRPMLWVIAGMLVVTVLILIVTVVRPVDLLPSEYLRLLQASSNHLGGRQGLLARVLSGVRDYFFEDMRTVILPLGYGAGETALTAGLGVPWLTGFVGFIFFLLVAAGMWLWFRREGLRIPLAFALIYIPALLVWSVPALRFFHPLQPQIFLAFLLSVSTIIFGVIPRVHVPARVGYAGIAVIVGVLILLNLLRDSRTDESKLHTGDLPQRTAWIRANTDSSSVIITGQPEVDYLYGDRKTEPYSALDQDNAGQLRYVLLAPDIVWQPKFSPIRDDETQQIWNEMEAWAKQGKATLAYQDAANAIRVYQLTP
jgi:hypothetical protein